MLSNWLRRWRGSRARPGPFALQRIETGSARIEIGVLGRGTPVVLLPGLGGAGSEQYGALATALAGAGFRAVAVNPRGVGRSRGSLEGLTLRDLAGDVADVVDQLGGSAHVVGRAFGNRVARVLATAHPECVRSLTLLAAGGRVPPGAGPSDAIPRVRPRTWPDAVRAQKDANLRTEVETWWAGGRAPMLVIQGLEDHTALPENGRMLARDHPERVKLVEVEGAGHHPLAERPEIVVPALVAFVEEKERAFNESR